MMRLHAATIARRSIPKLRASANEASLRLKYDLQVPISRVLMEQHHLETKCRPPQFRRLASDLKDRVRASLNAAKSGGVLQLSI